MSVAQALSLESSAEQSVEEAVRQCFEYLLSWLVGPEARALGHNDVEERLVVEGRELQRRMYQCYLDRSGPGDVGTSLNREDGTVFTRQRRRSRTLMSVFGSVEVDRVVYGAPKEKSIVPLDEDLNLPHRPTTYGVQRRIAREVARDPYEEAQETLREYTAAKVGKRQMEEIAREASADFEAFYESRSKDEAPPPEKSGELLVSTADCKGIVMREEDLTPETRKAAEAARSKVKADRGGKSGVEQEGMKLHRKRMAIVAATYTTERFIRTPEDVIREFRRETPRPEQGSSRRPKPEAKRVWASVEREKEPVFCDLAAEAELRDPEHRKQRVFLADGEKVLNRLALKILAPLACLTIILDIIHPLGYLWKAAHVFYPKGSPDALEWVTERFLWLLQGKASIVAASMRRTATFRGLSKKRRKPVDQAASYILKRTAYMRYNEYLAQGLPIASGVIEATCKQLVKHRFDRGGARWSLDGAEAVLRLRALYLSGDMEEYWRFHVEQERQRRYPDGRWSPTNGQPRLRLVK